jgi:twitching motility protein PilT
LSGDALASLKELGAVEHTLPARGHDRFSVVAARSGDDIWIEIRRRREASEVETNGHVDSQVVAETEAPQTDAPIAKEPEANLVNSASAAEEAMAAAEPGVEPAVPNPASERASVPSQVVPEPVAAGAVETEAGTSEVAAVTRPAVEQTSETMAPPAEMRTTAEAAESPAVPEPVHVALTSAPERATNESDEVVGRDVDDAVESMSPAPADTGVHAAVDVPSPQPVLVASGGLASSDFASAALTAMPIDPARQSGPPPDLPPAPPSPSPAPPVAGGDTEQRAAQDGPVTRTVRIEVPSRVTPPTRSGGVERLLRAADEAGASELFVISQARPYLRVGGNVRALHDEAPLLPADIETLIADLTPEPWRDAVRRGDPAEWLVELADVGRVRCSAFRDHRGPGANFHFALLRATTADDLQLSAEIRLLATEPDGLILVGGGPGSDAAAIVAAFVDILNHQRADYIVSLEPQIRVLHANREALVSQREVGHDSARALAAARAALREQPDVLVVEGVTTGEMAQVVIEAASQDRLVIASIDAPSGVSAVQRLVELVPAEQRPAARMTLARCFRGAVAQLLLRKTTGGRIAARELLTGSRAVARILADGNLADLSQPLADSGERGMARLVDAVVGYVRSGIVDVREALRKSPDVDLLIDQLRTAGVDLGEEVRSEKSEAK